MNKDKPYSLVARDDELVEDNVDETIQKIAVSQLEKYVNSNIEFVDGSNNRGKKRKKKETKNEPAAIPLPTYRAPDYISKAIATIKMATKRLEKEKSTALQRKHVNNLLLFKETTESEVEKEQKKSQTQSSNVELVNKIIIKKTVLQRGRDLVQISSDSMDEEKTMDIDEQHEDFDDYEMDSLPYSESDETADKLGDDNEGICSDAVNSKKEKRRAMLEQFKKKLGIVTEPVGNFLGKKKCKEAKVTCDSRSIQKMRPAPEVVVYNAPARSKKSAGMSDGTSALSLKLGSNSKLSQQLDDLHEFSLRKAKHDVFKFGINGLDTNDKSEAKLAMLIRLGAKAPKNPYVNYKQLIEEKKKTKKRQEEEHILPKSLVKKDNKKSIKQGKHKKKKKNRLDDTPHGIIGKYKDGVQKIPKKHISRIQKQMAKSKC